MEPVVDEDQEGSDVEQFLNGFDYYEEQAPSISLTEFNDSRAKFIRSGCFAALEEICMSELSACLSMLFVDAAPLLLQSAGVNSDLSVWITHW